MAVEVVVVLVGQVGGQRIAVDRICCNPNQCRSFDTVVEMCVGRHDHNSAFSIAGTSPCSKAVERHSDASPWAPNPAKETSPTKRVPRRPAKSQRSDGWPGQMST